MICLFEGCDIEFQPVSKVHKYCCTRHAEKVARKRFEDGAPIAKCERIDCTNTFPKKDRRKRFCSRSCAAKVNNTLYPKREKIDKECAGCDNTFKSNDSRQRYCSKSCAAGNRNSQTEAKVLQWIESGEDWSRKDHTIPIPVRKYLLKEAGNKCTKCGWAEPNPKLGRPILCIDHINGNWKDNRRDNLVVLCYNCHTLTPTFNALNIGSQSGRRPGEGKRRR